jgi:uncharacterized protein (TIGR00369 family)
MDLSRASLIIEVQLSFGCVEAFVSESKLAPVDSINQLIRENRIDDFASPNLALGMRPIEFALGTSRWSWESQPLSVLNPFGIIQGGYLAIFIDEMFGTAIASVLENGEWAVTAEVKLTYLRALRPEALTGAARVIRRTRTLAFMESSIANKLGEVAVTASSTWAISKA